jgi:hypothetical protein
MQSTKKLTVKHFYLCILKILKSRSHLKTSSKSNESSSKQSIILRWQWSWNRWVSGKIFFYFLSQESTLDEFKFCYGKKFLSLVWVFTMMSKQIFTHSWTQSNKMPTCHVHFVNDWSLSRSLRLHIYSIMSSFFYDFSPGDMMRSCTCFFSELAVNYAGILPWNINRWNYCFWGCGPLRMRQKMTEWNWYKFFLM